MEMLEGAPSYETHWVISSMRLVSSSEFSLFGVWDVSFFLFFAFLTLSYEITIWIFAGEDVFSFNKLFPTLKEGNQTSC